MKKYFTTIIFLSIVIGLFGQSKNEFDHLQSNDLNYLQNRIEYLLDEEADIPKMENILNPMHMNETTLDSSLQFHYYSISDSVKEKKTEYEWYSWGDYKTDLIFEWDGYNNQWVNYEKGEFEFDSNSVFHSYDYFRWNIILNDWVDYRHGEDYYDDNGNRDSTMSLKWNEDLNIWDKSTAAGYDYDNNGNQLFFVRWKANEDNEWIKNYKREYQYNLDGNRIFEIHYKWDVGLNEWLYTSMYEYYYNDIGLRDSTLLFVWEEGKSPQLINNNGRCIQHNNHFNQSNINKGYLDGEWDLWTKQEFEYNENHDVILSYHYWLHDQQWDISSKHEYEYDEHNNITLSTTYDRNNDNWSLNFKSEEEYTYEFNEEGRTIMWSSYDWDMESEVWIGRSKYNYLYNDEGKSLISIYFKWNLFDNDWNVDEKRFRYRSDVTGYPEFEFVDFLVYPNPAKNILNIKNERGQKVDCSIISISGQTLKQFETNGIDTRINIESLPKGVYFLQISIGSEMFVKKFITQ